MKKHLIPALLAVAVLGSACSSTPRTTNMLDQTRGDYMIAQSNPDVARYAPLEMKQAADALNKANASASNRDSDAEIDRLAYVAKQKIALAHEVAKQKSSEAEVSNAARERDRLRLEQRTTEANQAKTTADSATQAAEAARREAQDAQSKTIEAQRTSQEAQQRAAQLETQLAELAAKKTERGTVITFGDVLFGTDRFRLNANGMRTAQKLADILQQNPQRSVLVEGFTDSTGDAAYNQALSERRAASVQNALVEMGVPRARIATRGYGEAYPVAENTSAATRQLNRRVEIILSDEGGRIPTR